MISAEEYRKIYDDYHDKKMKKFEEEEKALLEEVNDILNYWASYGSNWAYIIKLDNDNAYKLKEYLERLGYGVTVEDERYYDLKDSYNFINLKVYID